MNIENAKQQAADAWNSFQLANENRQYLMGYFQAKLNTFEAMGCQFADGELDSLGRYEFLHVTVNRPEAKCEKCGASPDASRLWVKHTAGCDVSFPSM